MDWLTRVARALTMGAVAFVVGLVAITVWTVSHMWIIAALMGGAIAALALVIG
jgi:hypothetical protein